THEQAERLADAVRARLLTPGGIMATEYESGEQWDKPNGWAPLRLLTGMMVVWCILMVIMGFTHNYALMVTLRILLGIAEGP
ncbi:trehalase family glycosidase, partial [Klebsiella pneumoniae]|uniref:trehalase family glycosidase n=1 Tax=Klebsiella pneumoniae TaxID=573 RepID=UPI0027D7DD7B